MASKVDEPADSLEGLELQDQITSDLFEKWDQLTKQLESGDDVDARWQRGSAAKLLLQHLAVREESKRVVAERLREVGQADLAGKLEGDRVRRRELMDRLDELTRGQQAIMANTPDHDEVIMALKSVFDEEVGPERDEWLPAARRALGPAGERGLPSPRWVRTHSPTHPTPRPGRLAKLGPLRALWALYDHLRGSPSGGTSPEVDSGREHTPGMRP